MATANVSLLAQAGVKYIISTGGAAGLFTCGTDAGFATFVEPLGVVGPHRRRLRHRGGPVAERHPGPRLAHPDGARHLPGPPLQPHARDARQQQRREHGAVARLGRRRTASTRTATRSLAAVKSTLGFTAPSTWPSYVTVDLMTWTTARRATASASSAAARCQMGQSALQAAYNLHDRWGVPYAQHRADADDRPERREQRAVHPRRRRHGRQLRHRQGPRRRALLVVRPRRRLRRRAPRRRRATRWAAGTRGRTGT